MKSLRGIFLVLSILHFNLPLTSWARTPHSCYWSANKLAPDDYLPCYGSTTTAQYSCCQAGDKCLEGNACYDQDTGVTYQYGCTDPTFKDPHCPQKCNLDLEKSHWVGLIFCNGTNGLPNDSWVCHHPDNCGNRSSCASQVWGDTIQRQPPTGCENVKHGREYVALDAVGTIRDLVPLPAPTQTASWWLANSDRYQSVTLVDGNLTSRINDADYDIFSSKHGIKYVERCEIHVVSCGNSRRSTFETNSIRPMGPVSRDPHYRARLLHSCPLVHEKGSQEEEKSKRIQASRNLSSTRAACSTRKQHQMEAVVHG
ncbi:hypothetical protein DE146DRAFT_68518 [Phaeosphaeria sp. MPI-PUGE-AT-0046c]|nr:hypothetical protein DE146DRAFT_68518 [Phaeosphaeria sp. MPI-PUGE-AT-0046c]